MTRNLALTALAGGLVSLAAALATAQDAAVLDDLYGRGVHAYFSRDSFKAVELIGQAIENGSQDPRAYYFRGLALTNLGRSDDAKLDFKEGARLESELEVTEGVSAALQRVQGSARLELENYRKLARLNRRNARVEAAKRRYDEIESGDETVVRNRPRPTRPPAPLPEASEPDSTDPFEDGLASPPPRRTTTPPMPEPSDTPPALDPADETPPPTPKPAADPDDLFGTDDPAPKPATPKPATPKPAPAADPDDIFGAEPEPNPATPKPATPKPAPAADPDDLFGTEPEPETPAPKPEDEAAPAPGGDAAVAPATKPGRAGSSLFRAFSRAILPDEPAEPGAAKPSAAPVQPTAPVSDPFADDPEPAPPKAAPVKPAPAKPAPAKPAPAEEVEDPFG